MTPRIELLKETKLIGQPLRMSYAADRTGELWRSFAPRRKEIGNTVNADLYSVERYPDTTFFQIFDPTRVYEKWAAVEVSDHHSIPEDMASLIIPEGLYAVFHYKGKPSDAQDTFRFIYGRWLPASEYVLDARPHFALMGANYKGEHPDSEEEFWIPIRKK